MVAASTPAMGSSLWDMMLAGAPMSTVIVGGEYLKGYELNVRYDILEGAQKFDATKAPLFSDAKAVLRLSYGAGAKGPMNMISETTTMMLDALYNVDKQWFVAFRYSSVDDTVDTWSRMSIGGGYKMTDKSTLKLDYTTNTEPDTATGGDELDNNSVALLMTVLW